MRGLWAGALGLGMAGCAGGAGAAASVPVIRADSP